MKDFTKILFPLDFSGISPKIVPYVIHMGKKFNAEIHFLFVTRVLEYFSYMYVANTSIANIEKEIMEGAKQKMKEFISEYVGEYPNYKTAVIRGDAAEEIINYIKAEDIDLVIIGTHGRKGLEKILIGSVTERVIKSSPVPVLSINPYMLDKK